MLQKQLIIFRGDLAFYFRFRLFVVMYEIVLLDLTAMTPISLFCHSVTL